MDNIIGGRSAVIQVTFLMEDRGFCKDVFATVEKPTRYYNRIFENYTGEVATWYSASPSIFESDCRISPQTIFEVVYQGRLCARDGNGDFEGKIPFVPFFEFERREAIRCSKKLPNLKGYEQMKENCYPCPVVSSIPSMVPVRITGSMPSASAKRPCRSSTPASGWGGPMN